MGDISERSAVNNSRCVFQCLYQVRFNGILQEQCHRTGRLQVAGGYRFTLAVVRNHHSGQARLQIIDVRCQAQDCHDFGSHGNIESALPHHAVALLSQADDDVAQGTVVHIHHALPHDFLRYDIQRISLMDVVIQHCRQQVVCRSDGMEIPGKMQVDIIHRYHLGISAAGSAALNAEARSQRRLSQRGNGLLSQLVQRHRQSHVRGGLSFSGRSRVDGGYQHQFSVGTVLQPLQHIRADLRLIFSIQLQFIIRNIQLGCDLHNWFHLRFLCNLYVCLHIKPPRFNHISPTFIVAKHVISFNIAVNCSFSFPTFLVFLPPT